MLDRRSYIAQRARQLGLDPHAVLAVASVEGGFGGAIGDQGTSYGPFQLHRGGALPRGRGNQWANSRQGIDYALNQIARVSRGKHGQAAVNAIVRLFERPADPDSEVAKALSRYGKVGGGAAVPSAAGPARLAPAPSNPVDKTALIQALTQHGGPDVTGIAQMLSQARSAPAGPERPPQVERPTAHPHNRRGGGITELFYDPEGGIKNGHAIHAIGGHKDHVHVSMPTLAAQRAVLARALAMGLHVGEDNVHDPVDPVHVKGSYHYQRYGKSKLARAADISGDPRKMDAFYRWVASNYG